MICSEYSLTVEPKDLGISPEQIVKLWGYSKSGKSESFFPMIKSLLEQSQKYMKIQTGYVLYGPQQVKVDKSIIKINSIVLKPGKVVVKHFSGIESLTIFTSSLGLEFDNWSKKHSENGRILENYITDTIGSLAVERVTDILESHISKKYSHNGLGTTNRYSPGYCGWSVEEQKQIFQLLPENFCSISLNQSSLMIPLKSVSGIIGIGPGISKKQYECKACTVEGCLHKDQLKGG